MEKFLQALFDFNKIPTKLILVIWVCCSLILFIPEQFLAKLNLTEFLKDYGKFIGVTFLLTSGFTFIVIWTSIVSGIRGRKLSKKIRQRVKEHLKSLDFHEKALLREFWIHGKYTLQLPFDNDTVVGLANKRIIYQASNTGFQYYHGAYFPYTISDFVLQNLTYQMIDMPENPTDQEQKRILGQRPDWAKERARIEGMMSSF